MKSATLKVIPLKEIVVDNNQPRKAFEQVAMDELTDSIRTKGVLQPILVRPYGEKYKLVSGERRYRASLSVNAVFKERDSIPALVAEMDDNEALEAQIVENLQRKDVNPMEEAVAFKQLQDRFNTQEIALKVGKSEKYVLQRISLNGLIDDLQMFMYSGRMSLSDGYKLARISPEDQKVVLKESPVPKNWQDKKDFFFNAPDWKFQRVGHDLADATFKLEDKSLYPEMGDCGSCRFNSKNNPSLFEDLNKKRICHNSVCFNVKTGRSFVRTMEEVIADPNVLLVNTNYGWLDDDDKIKLAEVRKLGAVVLDRDSFTIVDEPDVLQTLDEFLEEQKDYEGFDEMDPQQQKQSMKEWKEDYDAMKEEHASEMEQYMENVSNAREAFVLMGHGAGKRIKVVLNSGKKGSHASGLAAAGSGASAEVVAIEQEIAAIKERSKRNKELDREKVYKLLVPKLQSDDYKCNAALPLTAEENWALAIALMECGYEIRDAVRKLLKIKSRSMTALYEAIKKESDLSPVFNTCFRMLIVSKLINSYHLDRERHDDAAAVYGILGRYFPEDLQKAEADQQSKADKREKNAGLRLDGLKEKLKELKAAKPKKK